MEYFLPVAMFDIIALNVFATNIAMWYSINKKAGQ
jgi:hypothetical protein